LRALTTIRKKVDKCQPLGYFMADKQESGTGKKPAKPDNRRKKARPKKKRAKGPTVPRPKPAYPLKDIKALAAVDDTIKINGNALDSADEDFGWGPDEISNAIGALTGKHFVKSEDHRRYPSIKVDYYRARGLKGENVYTHFYTKGGVLIVSSFKQI